MFIARKVVQVCVSAFFVSLCINIPIIAQDVFDAVPADALFAVRINNFEYTLGQIDQFLIGLAPTPNMASMMGRMQLANILGDPNLSNVNLRGQMAVFGMASQKDPNALPQIFIAGLIPVTDYKKFIALNPSATQPDANGIATIGRKRMITAQIGDYAMLVESRRYGAIMPINPNEYAAIAAAVKAAKAKNLTSALGANQRESSAKARLWAYGNVRQAQQLYGPMIVSKMEEAKKAMTAKDPNMAQFSQFAAIYVDIVKSLMNQTKDITIAANPKADSLGLSGTFTAIPCTEIAKTLTASAAANGPNPLLGYLPENAMMSMAWQVNKPFAIQKYTSLIDTAAPLLGPKFTPEEKTKVTNLVKDTINSLGQSLVYSASFDPNSKSPFNAMYVFDVADAAAFQKNMDSAREITNAPYMVDFVKSFGLKIAYDCTRNAEQYNGVSIDVTKVMISPFDPNNQMAKMIAKMYGESLTVKKAMVNGLALCTVGANADAQLKGLIDTAKSGGPKGINPEIKTAMAMIPDSNQTQFVGTYNYLRALQMSAGFMQMVPTNTTALQQIVSKSNIAFDANIGNGDIAFTVVVPKQHVLEIKSAFETVSFFKQAKSCRP